MHHLAVKSNLADTTHTHTHGGAAPEAKLCNKNPPLCPKPRRLGSAVPEFIKTLGCGVTNHSQLNPNGRSGIINMIISENTKEEGGGGGGGAFCGGSSCGGCAQSCYSGSPPGRSSNPLVHDVQFIQYQMEQYSSPFSRTKLQPEKFGFASFH